MKGGKPVKALNTGTNTSAPTPTEKTSSPRGAICSDDKTLEESCPVPLTSLNKNQISQSLTVHYIEFNHQTQYFISVSTIRTVPSK